MAAMLATAHRDVAPKRACCRQRHEGGKGPDYWHHDGAANERPEFDAKIPTDLRP